MKYLILGIVKIITLVALFPFIMIYVIGRSIYVFGGGSDDTTDYEDRVLTFLEAGLPTK